MENKYVVVNFEDLDTSKISFDKPKQGKKGGSFVSIKYDNKELYVRYPKSITPFGARKSTENKSIDLSINLDEGITHFKALELDDFLIDKCVENSVLWGLGGSKDKPVDRLVVEGYDSYGDKGKWIRLVKHSFKVDKLTNERELTDYPPRLNFTFIQNNTGKIMTKFFDEESLKLEGVTSENIESVVSKYCEVSILARWSFIYLGNFGASLKPRLEQVRVYPSTIPDFDDCVLE